MNLTKRSGAFGAAIALAVMPGPATSVHVATSDRVGTAALGCPAAQVYWAASFPVVIGLLARCRYVGTCLRAAPDKCLTLDHFFRPFPQTFLRNTFAIRVGAMARVVRCLW